MVRSGKFALLFTVVAAWSGFGGGSAGAQVTCRGFDASFVQLSGADKHRDYGGWQSELDVLQSVGVTTLVIQYSGDASGGYDEHFPARPVRSLLRAAGDRGMRVYVGLYQIPDWFSAPLAAAARLPAPLDDQAGRVYLRDLTKLRGFAGWYLPGEVDELTWNRPERIALIKAYFDRASKSLRRIALFAPIMLSPFYGETQATTVYADFWREVLANRPVSILAMQDGRGARATADETVRQLLEDLKPVLDRKGIDLWSTVETFRQIHGTPIDAQPFAAVPATVDSIVAGLDVALPISRRAIAFDVLDYMHPLKTPAQLQLYTDYVARCAP